MIPIHITYNNSTDIEDSEVIRENINITEENLPDTSQAIRDFEQYGVQYIIGSDSLKPSPPQALESFVSGLDIYKSYLESNLTLREYFHNNPDIDFKLLIALDNQFTQIYQSLRVELNITHEEADSALTYMIQDYLDFFNQNKDRLIEDIEEYNQFNFSELMRGVNLGYLNISEIRNIFIERFESFYGSPFRGSKHFLGLIAEYLSVFPPEFTITTIENKAQAMYPNLDNTAKWNLHYKINHLVSRMTNYGLLIRYTDDSGTTLYRFAYRHEIDTTNTHLVIDSGLSSRVKNTLLSNGFQSLAVIARNMDLIMKVKGLRPQFSSYNELILELESKGLLE